LYSIGRQGEATTMKDNDRGSIAIHCYPFIKDEVTAFVLGLECRLVGKLPHISGLYFAVDGRDRVQYVGCAVDIGKRWNGHKLRGIALQSEWRIFFKEVDYKNFRSKEHEEAFFIATLRPLHNQSLKCPVHG
jgi:hypothetical protein